jgi:uncharacterized protein YciI
MGYPATPRPLTPADLEQPDRHNSPFQHPSGRRALFPYAVIGEAGPGWAEGGIYQQPHVDEHAAFMNTLADEGFLLFAGPLAGTEAGRVRVLLTVNAESEAEIHRRLAEDPWVLTGQLVTISGRAVEDSRRRGTAGRPANRLTGRAVGERERTLSERPDHDAFPRGRMERYGA